MTNNSCKYLNKVFSSNNNGDFIVLEYKNAMDIKIKFLKTGTVKQTRADKIRNGNITDPYYPTLYNKGFFGIGDYKTVYKGKPTKAYRKWISLLKRCYSKKYQNEAPWYKGTRLCEDWHNFQLFAEWFYDTYPNDGIEYEIDKDKKSNGLKLYSPETCSWVTKRENVQMAKCKNEYSFKSPSGVIYTFNNLKEFCDEHKLNKGNMHNVFCGRAISCKGWTLSEGSRENRHCKNNYSFQTPRGKVYKFKNLQEFCKKKNLSFSCMYRVYKGERKQHNGWKKYEE